MNRSRISRVVIAVAGVSAAVAGTGLAQAKVPPPGEVTGLLPGAVGELIERAAPPQPPAAPVAPVAPAPQPASAPAPAPQPAPAAAAAPAPSAPAPAASATAEPSGAGSEPATEAQSSTAGQPAGTVGEPANTGGAPADAPEATAAVASTADFSELDAEGDESSLPFTGFQSMPTMVLVAVLALLSGFALRRAARRAG